MIRSEARKSGAAPASADPLAGARDVDLGALVRIGLWGGMAAACLLGVAFAVRTETGKARFVAAIGASGAPAVERAAPLLETQDEVRRVTETIRNLAEDRDRLLARMTALERNYEDVTGSIGRLSTAARPSAEPAVVPAPEPAPIVNAPAASPTATPPSASGRAAVPQSAVSEPAKTAFGVDVGGGPTLASLRAAWDRIRRNHATLLDGLHPVITVRDGRGGQVELRLIAGPVANAESAARLCAALAAAGLSCQPTVFDGQRLAQR
ncbi:MAG: hypothetical protein AB7V13_08945 [Pseudorhodoplanes sp.]|uniref:hypothetical protein n=1 Tax=Pseudorhodoplanes sp. TaxID=1934341 RepID=UPI003D0EB610